MKDPDYIRITAQHDPNGDGKDWIVDIAAHRDGKSESDSWHSATLENMILGIPEILKRYIADKSETQVAHHD